MLPWAIVTLAEAMRRLFATIHSRQGEAPESGHDDRPVLPMCRAS
jgi:hypothetical protein